MDVRDHKRENFENVQNSFGEITRTEGQSREKYKTVSLYSILKGCGLFVVNKDCTRTVIKNHAPSDSVPMNDIYVLPALRIQCTVIKMVT